MLGWLPWVPSTIHDATAPTQVVQVKTDDREGYTALQLGGGAKRPKQLPGTLRGHFKAAGARWVLLDAVPQLP